MKKFSSKGFIKFIIFTALTIIASVLDNLFTYIGSPDLSLETNPIVYSLGYGWGVLIAVNVIIISIFIYLYYYSFVRFRPCVVECSNFKEYRSMLYFNRPDKFIWTLYKFPKNKRVYSYTLACTGYVATIILPIMRLKYVSEWIIFLTSDELWRSYCDLIKNFSFNTVLGRIDSIFIVFFGAVFLCLFWFYKQYKINKKELKNFR